MHITKLAMAAAAAWLLSATAQAAPVAGQGTWETTLHARDLDGNGSIDAYWDQVLDITWLRQVAGPLNWDAAMAWSGSLAIGSFSDWRLPKVVDQGDDGAFNCTKSGTDCDFNVDTATSEMAHLFHLTLGNKSIYDPFGNYLQPGWGLSNTGPFDGLLEEYHWSATPDGSDAGYAWFFDLYEGRQDVDDKLAANRFLVVHAGDIVRAVPEPGALALASIALLAAFGMGRRRRPARPQHPAGATA